MLDVEVRRGRDSGQEGELAYLVFPFHCMRRCEHLAGRLLAQYILLVTILHNLAVRSYIGVLAGMVISSDVTHVPQSSCHEQGRPLLACRR